MIELNDKTLKRFQIQLKKIYVGKADMKRARPVLNQINYTDNGHVQITNSHVAVRLSNVHNKSTNDKLYPNMDGIFKLPYDLQEIDFKIQDMKPLEDHLNVLYRNGIKQVRITFNSEGITIVEQPDRNRYPHETFLQSQIKQQLDLSNEYEIIVNTRYLHDALMFFRLIKAPKITIHLSENPLRPINLTYENLHYIIVPIRTK